MLNRCAARRCGSESHAFRQQGELPEGPIGAVSKADGSRKALRFEFSDFRYCGLTIQEAVGYTIAMPTDPAARKPYQYHISYQAEPHPNGISKAELEAKGNVGGCDAIFFASILFPPDGSYSVLFSSKDGRTGEDLNDDEWFKIWMLLSKRLGESETLQEGKRDFAQFTWEAIRDILFGKKQGTCAPECACSDEYPDKKATH